MNDPNEMTRTFYLELKNPSTAPAIQAALESCGLEISDEIRTVTRNYEGAILTNLLAQGIWEHRTGNNSCTHPCPGPETHRAWAQLSDEQKDTFLQNYARFVENCRVEELRIDILMEGEEEFQNIRLTPHH